MRAFLASACLLFVLAQVVSGESVSVGPLTLEVPPALARVVSDQRDRVDDLHVNEWRSEDGRELHVLYWPHFPRIDRGSMIVASQEDITVSGAPAKLSLTKQFFGTPNEVLVVHLHVEESWYVIYVQQMTREDFLAILATAHIQKQRSPTRGTTEHGWTPPKFREVHRRLESTARVGQPWRWPE